MEDEPLHLARFARPGPLAFINFAEANTHQHPFRLRRFGSGAPGFLGLGIARYCLAGKSLEFEPGKRHLAAVLRTNRSQYHRAVDRIYRRVEQQIALYSARVSTDEHMASRNICVEKVSSSYRQGHPVCAIVSIDNAARSYVT